MSNYESSPFAKTCELIERAGVDPRSVALDPPPTSRSYWTFNMLDGRKVYDPDTGRPHRTQRLWPLGWGRKIARQFEIDSRTPQGRFTRGNSV